MTHPQLAEAVTQLDRAIEAGEEPPADALHTIAQGVSFEEDPLTGDMVVMMNGTPVRIIQKSE